MKTLAPSRWLAAATLIAALIAPTVGRSAPARRKVKPQPAAPASVEAKPQTGMSLEEVEGLDVVNMPASVRSRIGVNLTSTALETPGTYRMLLEIELDSLGLVQGARIVRGGTPFDSAAVDAVRWWLFEPARREGGANAVSLRVPFEIVVPADADPVSPDVLTLALQAEAAGDLRGALDAWTGVCARVGTNPMLADDWTPRVHAIRIAAQLKPAPTVPMMTEATALGTRSRMQRDISRAGNMDYRQIFDEVLRVTPWYGEVYRWRASARAASGDRDGAIRDVRCFALAVRDSASQVLAGRALRALAARDTVAALTMLK